MISNNLHAWATSLGITRETIQRALSAAGIKYSGGKIAARDVFTALTGDKEAAMTRKLNAEAEAKERENRIAEGDTIPMEEAVAIYGKKIFALVQQLDAIPALVPGLSLAQRGVLVSKLESIKEQARKSQ